jgi:hypothetical protein
METFAAPRPLVDNDRYPQERKAALAALDLSAIDEPVADIVARFAELTHCYTLQSCYGHFIFRPDQEDHSLEPVPPEYRGPVKYKIAYVALCIENSPRGKTLRQALEQISSIDPEYVQFCSADWFWERQVNSYALQVEPERFKNRDQVMVDHQEARHIQRTRDRFFQEIRRVLARELAAANDDPPVRGPS